MTEAHIVGFAIGLVIGIILGFTAGFLVAAHNPKQAAQAQTDVNSAAAVASRVEGAVSTLSQHVAAMPANTAAAVKDAVAAVVKPTGT